MPDKPGFLESFSPWGSRSSTPKPGEGTRKSLTDQQLGELTSKKGIDHSVTKRPRINPREYPSDCPKASVRWFYAVDFPKRKPLSSDLSQKERKPLPAPKKYSPFSKRDSRSIELAFQNLAERADRTPQAKAGSSDGNGASGSGRGKTKETEKTKLGSENAGKRSEKSIEDRETAKVPVNEDYLFDVDVESRELAPAYWLGPVYDVRRGSWFYQEGSAFRPCEENLAGQLEEGYLKVKPWRNYTAISGIAPVENKTPSRPASREGLDSKDPSEPPSNPSGAPQNDQTVPAKFELQTQRLFGLYINSVVTFQDANTAWILSDDILSRMSSTVYQRFAGGGHLGGTKVVRGYNDTTKPKEPDKPDTTLKSDGSANAPGQAVASEAETKTSQQTATDQTQPEPRLLKLERQMSNFVSSPTEDLAKQEADVRQREEDEIKADYVDADGEEQGRDIEHLVLVTHGIGQRLGLRMESVNFIHDVNVLRKTLKSVYQDSPDLQMLNNEIDKLPKNCRVQVLPVVWRHLLDFPKKSFKQNREQDLADTDDDYEYPNLDSITVDGVPAIRQLISDLALDILLYQSAYRDHIASIVLQECNRVYELFIKRNPDFHGKVSLIGHSLGSAILFDILCRQRDVAPKQSSKTRPRTHSQRTRDPSSEMDLGLKFEVEDFYCLGSPLGLYQMLKGNRVQARTNRQGLNKAEPLDDPFLGPAPTKPADTKDSILSPGVSSPKCARLFNIFHPADPIAYRIEPLISNAMSSLKPQPLPYTKKGIFGVQGQGFSGIGARVGQSVSGMWSNLTSGVASSLLNRSLGLTGESQIGANQSANLPTVQHKRDGSQPTIAAADAVAGGGGTEKDTAGVHPPTLLDSEKVTLYAEFERQRKSLQSDGSRDLGESAEWMESERRSKKLRAEESKVRALNSNGRVDFSIQEGVFDISLIASIASHLSYWADEDVSHFTISQLLSRQRIIQR